MNVKAEAFKQYLEERKIEGVFTMSEGQDEWDSVLFRSQIDINGNRLPVGLIFDKSVYGMIRVLIAPQARTEENEGKILAIVNEYNKRYKPFKFYLDDRDSLVLDVSLLAKDGTDCGEMVYAMLDVVIKNLEESYKDIMRSIWA